jgi:hypothetical protein
MLGHCVHFEVGEAEHLPFADWSLCFTSTESSHTYPHLRILCRGVRVLNHGANFFTPTCFRGTLNEDMRSWSAWFQDPDEHDITANVLASCNGVAATLQGIR